MASSGTVGATIYQVNDLMESISRRCGVKPEKMSPEHIDVISGVLWRLLAMMSNRGINLWRVYHKLLPFNEGQQVYPLAQGDIDIMRLVYRTVQRAVADSVVSSSGGATDYLSDGLLTPAFTQSGADGNVVFDWGSGTTVSIGIVGINSAAARTYTLVFEISSDGVSWTPVYAPGAVAYAAGGWNWYEIEPAGTPVEFFRVRETGGQILSLGEVVLASKWSDVDITRWSLDQWSVNPSKRSVGTPRQYYEERLLTPQYSLWPMPGSMDILNCMCAWVHRHIEDVGTPQNTLDIPQRWYQTLVDTASWVCLPELPDADLTREQLLKGRVDFSLIDTEKEERDKSPIQLTVGIGGYTK